jgi:hypothetical protein
VGQQNGKLGQIDGEFLHFAAETNMAEMKLGKLAQDRATAAKLKPFGVECNRLPQTSIRGNRLLATGNEASFPSCVLKLAARPVALFFRFL